MQTSLELTRPHFSRALRVALALVFIPAAFGAAAWHLARAAERIWGYQLQRAAELGLWAGVAVTAVVVFREYRKKI